MKLLLLVLFCMYVTKESFQESVNDIRFNMMEDENNEMGEVREKRSVAESEPEPKEEPHGKSAASVMAMNLLVMMSAPVFIAFVWY